MEKRIALVGIMVEDLSSAARINEILHQYGEYILGRMGIPHREKGISIISVAVEAPGPVISALSGKLGMLPGVQTKTIYSSSQSAKENQETHGGSIAGLDKV
jgi:putative iron-only hydrogenase system regulator